MNNGYDFNAHHDSHCEGAYLTVITEIMDTVLIVPELLQQSA